MYFSIKPGPTGFTPEYTPYGNRTITHSCNPPWTIRIMHDWTTRDMFTGLIVRVSLWHLPADICQPILVIREDASGYVKTSSAGLRPGTVVTCSGLGFIPPIVQLQHWAS